MGLILRSAYLAVHAPCFTEPCDHQLTHIHSLWQCGGSQFRGCDPLSSPWLVAWVMDLWAVCELPSLTAIKIYTFHFFLAVPNRSHYLLYLQDIVHTAKTVELSRHTSSVVFYPLVFTAYHLTRLPLVGFIPVSMCTCGPLVVNGATVIFRTF